ncbi:MAG: protein-methionine-sulfoxide reductase catalytic subunit MsrP [Rhodospirillaceae bacterium]|nr:protein-methionine-sulfoxide reductase catalytic subunit MsrP [Rhodospirillaceae bacterium]
MFVHRRRGWEIPENRATPESVFLQRRALAKTLAAGPILAASAPLLSASSAFAAADPSAGLYPVGRNPKYTVDRALTPERIATTYNNFYEFGSHKQIHTAAQRLETRPWVVTIDGAVEKPMKIDIDDLLKKMPLEERVYAHRCVEAWSMVVPWSGFPLKALIDLAKPLGSAKYLVMQTFKNPKVAPGQRQIWYPWPYTEGLTMFEAANQLAFMVTGLYGKPLPRQNGAPLRLAVPWKYGFKHVKSIVRFHFSDKRPVSFWEKLQAREYGFWANVNPKVAHPRWSQASERDIGTGKRIPTKPWNGYGDYVAAMYANMKGEVLFR